MPNELRIIRFQLDEVAIAIKSFSSRINLSVPATRILDAHVAPDGSPNTLLRYEEEEKVIPITNNRLAACLIAYCQKIKIPLPRKATKSLHVSKQYMDLRIGMPMLGNISVSSSMRDGELDTGSEIEIEIEIETEDETKSETKSEIETESEIELETKSKFQTESSIQDD